VFRLAAGVGQQLLPDNDCFQLCLDGVIGH
jgi:hypothetical protein